MTEAKPETLAGDEAPSAALMLKWIGIVLGLAALCVVVVGLLLPREWHVGASVDIDAPLEDIHGLVADVERWDEWMFDPAVSPQDMRVLADPIKSLVEWEGQGSKGAIWIVEADPRAGVRWDGKIDADKANNRGRIEYAVLDDGRVRVTLIDEGTLPQVFGGYFVPVMNSALSQHFSAALERLAVAAEGATDPADGRVDGVDP